MEGILKSPGPGQEKGLPGDCSTMRQEPLGVCGDSRQSGRGPMGGYQARCQFHRRNLKTDCKQEFVVEGPEREDKYNCIRRLM